MKDTEINREVGENSTLSKEKDCKKMRLVDLVNKSFLESTIFTKIGFVIVI